MTRAVKHFRVAVLAAILVVSFWAVGVVWQTAVAANVQTRAIIVQEDGGWVINEIHADPANNIDGDANGDGERDTFDDEFVEIVNNTGGEIDISGWIISDSDRVRHTFPAGTIIPDQCAVLVFGGGTPTGGFGGAIVQTASSGRLELNNSGDKVTLSDGVSDQAIYEYGNEGNDDQSLTRDPDITGPEPLVKHTTVTAANGALFSPGAQLNGDPFPGCDAPTDAAPEVVSTDPPDGATAVPLTATLTITFSEPVSVTGAWYDITCTASGAHTAGVSGSGATYVLDPEPDFVNGESCTVTIFAAQVSDLDDDDPPDKMNADYTWSFGVGRTGWIINEIHADPDPNAGDANGDGVINTGDDEFVEIVNDTGSAVDISGWTLADEVSVKHTFPSGTVLADQCAIVVFGGGAPTGVFGQALVQTASSGQLGLNNGGDTVTFNNGVSDQAKYRYGGEGGDDQSLTRDPDITGSEPLIKHTTAAGANGALFSPGTRIDGVAFAGCAAPDAAPEVTNTNPAEGAIDVTIDANLTITFSEDVAVSGEWFDIACANSGTRGVADTAVSGGPLTFTIDPNEEFAHGESCTVTIFAAQVSDLDDDDPPDQMTADYAWSFTTAAEADAAPEIIAVDPPDGATAVPLTATLTITFSEPVTVSGGVAIACTVSGEQAAAVSGGPESFTLTPAQPFDHGESCTVTVRADQVSDLDNDDPPDQMAADYAWSFTTQATADSAPQIIDTIPADGATKVALDATLTITFNEPVTISDEVALECTASGSQSAAVSGGPESFTLTPAQPFEHGESCTVTIRADQVSDLDNDDPPDHMAADTTWSFATAVFTDLLINEVDSDTPESGTDATEFVELYASGTGNIHLGGLVVLFFNGNGDKSYAAFDLNGYRTDANGYFLLGNTAVSGVDLTFGNGILQNGADAVALVEGTASDYPNGTPVTGTIALDALVYDTDDADDPQLLTLLNPGQPQVNENGRGDKDNHSNQRCPNGAGGQRNTAGYKQNSPTPGAANDCLTDAAPAVTATNPDNGATAVPIASSLTITFSEAVNVTPASFSLTCDAGGAQPFDLSGGGAVYTLDPHNDLPPTTSCTVTVLADQVSDVDADDPPDQMTADYSFSFTTAAPADAAPAVALTLPAADATEVALESQIVISFTEPVLAAADAFEVACEASQTADISVRALPPIAPQLYVLTRTPAFDHGERCTVTVRATAVSDLDSDDPPDNLAADYVWSFTTAVFTGLLINEVDADTHGTDTAEFIELYDGGRGDTHLGGLVIVLFNGSNDAAYGAFDLRGRRTNADGYFVLGNATVAKVDLVIDDSTLQNGADAVALVVGRAEDYPNGTPVTGTLALDALVYDTDDPDDPELLTLLNPGQPQVNENGRGDKDNHSNQRCPNGEGGQRNTAGYRQNPPTPGAINNCVIDDPPAISSVVPPDGAVDVPVSSQVQVTFSEDVAVSGDWFQMVCTASGTRRVADTAVSGGPRTFTIDPNADFARGEVCNATIFAAQVSDLDTDDPPDQMTADYTWSFTISDAPPPDVDILINEVDADTPDSDTAEFVELYDGGRGSVSLNGLVIVFYNGTNDQSYRTIDLTGHQTDANGYFVLGNAAVPNVDLVFPNGGLQNGADAVALYVGSAADFPNGTEVTTTNLLDALVYDTGQEDDEGLLVLLNSGQPQVNENGRGSGPEHSNQRCPNGEGGQRNTAGYRQNPPTPGAVNNCLTDDPPAVASTVPADGAVDVPVNSNVTVTFSEDVTVSGNWFEIACAVSGVRSAANAAVSGGPRTFTIDPNTDFARGEVCNATIFAA